MTRLFLTAAVLALVTVPALAETRIEITRGNAYTTERGLFGNTYPVAISPSGVVYYAPGSKEEKSLAGFFRSVSPAATPAAPHKCPDGKPARFNAHGWSNPRCDADRPQ